MIMVSAAAASAIASCGSTKASSGPRPDVTPTPAIEVADGVQIDGDAEQAIIASWNNIIRQHRRPDESLNKYTIVVSVETKEYSVDFLLKARVLDRDAPPNAVALGGGWVCRVETSSFRVKFCFPTQ